MSTSSAIMALRQTLTDQWLTHWAVPEGEREVVVALSGGMDSVVLLHALQSLAWSLANRVDDWVWDQGESESSSQSALMLRAVHINHQLHSHADDHANFCRQLCRQWAIPLSVVTLDWSRPEHQRLRSLGVEAAARQLRYAALADVVADTDSAVIVTAHHQDDQIETLLLNLARGSGVAGLSSMSPISTLPIANQALPLWRPLLALSKATLQDYATDQLLSWVDDPTNTDESLRRNYLRQRVIPVLEAMWPSFTHSAARSIAHWQTAQTVLKNYDREWLAANAHPDCLALASLREMSVERQHWLCRAWLLCSGWSSPNADRWQEFIRQVFQKPFSDSYAELVYRESTHQREHRVIAERGYLWRLPEIDEVVWQQLSVSWAEILSPQRAVSPNDAYSHEDSRTFSYEWLIGRIDVTISDLSRAQLRNGQFRVLSHSSLEALTLSAKLKISGDSHRRVLKKMLQARSIPGWMRPYLPVLVDNEKILWIGAVGFLADANDHTEISLPAVKITWSCPGVSASIHPRLESSADPTDDS